MAVRIVFLGPLRDAAGSDSLEVSAPLDWEGLLAAVAPELVEQLQSSRVHVACGGEVLADKTTLMARDGEEVALPPPVSGG